MGLGRKEKPVSGYVNPQGRNPIALTIMPSQGSGLSLKPSTTFDSGVLTP